MKRVDRIGGMICLIIAAGVIWQSAIIPMGNWSKPGPGFMPFWAGVILALLCGFLWLEAGMGKSPSAPIRIFSHEGRWTGVIWTAASLLAYGFFIELLGFMICTFFFMFVMFYFLGHQKWWASLTGSILVTWIAHAIFKLALKVQLPAGLFKI